MFGRVVIQKHLRKMYSVKSAFAKVARNRSIIFNYTLDQDFPIIILSFLLNNIYIYIYKNCGPVAVKSRRVYEVSFHHFMSC